MAGDAPITSGGSSNISLDRDKFLAAKLLERAHLKLVAVSVCEKVSQPKGSGTTAYFVRYKRMNVPLASLSEGVAPDDNSLSVEEVTSTLDQWGDVLTLTDVAVLTTKHPLMQIAMELLSDNAARVMDREVQLVWLSGTNVSYGGGAASRSLVPAPTSNGALRPQDLHAARISLTNNGAPPRFGPSNMAEKASGKAATGNMLGGGGYVAICSEEIVADILGTTGTGTLWTSVAQYQNSKSIYNGEVGTYLGFRIVTTNFIPRFKLLGDATVAVASGGDAGITGFSVTAQAGGSLAAVAHYFKVTRIDRTRGFEEDISIRHSITPTAGQELVFAMPNTAGYAYNVYVGTTDSDASLFKANSAPLLPGTSVTVEVAPTSGDTAPANIASSGVTAVHPIFIHGAGSCKWVGLQNLEFISSGDGATTHNPLKQIRTIGYKFMAKAMIPDQNRLLRLEVSSNYST